MGKLVVAIVGTYRQGKTIDTAVREVLRAAESAGARTELIDLRDRRIEFCTNCRSCTQEPGPERGQCTQDDDMGAILDQIDAADAIVLASPVNYFTVTALMKRFIERTIVYGYWPWATAPKNRDREHTKRALTITSSGAPTIIASLIMRHPQTLLGNVAKLMGARKVNRLHFGLSARTPQATLSEKHCKRAYEAGRKLVS